MNRLYELDIPIFAITGGIATGKSFVTNLLKENGEKVIDADRLIKEIYAQAETLIWMKANYPQAVENKSINFKILRKLFFSDQSVKLKIEAYLYSKLKAQFLTHINHDQKYIIYDIPLLFEKSLETKFDAIVLVHCSRKEQLRRLCKRDKIEIKLAEKILDQQIDINQKISKTDYLIDNNLDENNKFKNLENQVHTIFENLKRKFA